MLQDCRRAGNVSFICPPKAQIVTAALLTLTCVAVTVDVRKGSLFRSFNTIYQCYPTQSFNTCFF